MSNSWISPPCPSWNFWFSLFPFIPAYKAANSFLSSSLSCSILSNAVQNNQGTLVIIYFSTSLPKITSYLVHYLSSKWSNNGENLIGSMGVGRDQTPIRDAQGVIRYEAGNSEEKRRLAVVIDSDNWSHRIWDHLEEEMHREILIVLKSRGPRTESQRIPIFQGWMAEEASTRESVKEYHRDRR